MIKKVSLFISIIFHPIFVNLLAMWLLFQIFPSLVYSAYYSVQWLYLGFVFISTGLVPLIWVLFTNMFSAKTSYMLHEKEERNMPYILTSALYLFDFYLSKKTGAPIILSAYLLACSSIVVAVLITNLKTKISVHATSMGALVALLIVGSFSAEIDMRYLLAIAFFLSGVVITARLMLNSHTVVQVLSGYLLGFFLMWFIL